MGGGTSIMPRVAPTLYEFVELDNGDYLKVSEAVFRIFDRQDWLRVNRARARIKVLIDKIGIDEFRDQVEEELKGDWVAERDFDPTSLLLLHDEEANAPAAGGSLRVTQRRRHRFRALPRVERGAAAPGRASRPSTSRHPRRPHPRAVPRHRRDPCATTPAATRARRSSRTSCCAGCATSRVYEVWQGLTELGLGELRRRRDHRHGLAAPAPTAASSGITSSMGLNARVQRARCKELDIDRPADQADPHQELRLPQRLQPAPHRQHRVLRRVDQGRRQDHPRLHPAHRRQLRGRRGHLRRPAEVAAALQARARRRGALAAFYEAEREEGEEFNAFAERVGTDSFTELVKDLSMPVEFTVENMDFFIDWQRERALPGDPGRGRVRGLARPRQASRAGTRGAPPAHRARMLLPEGGDGAGAHAAAAGARPAGVHDRHRRAVPRDLRHLARVRRSASG